MTRRLLSRLRSERGLALVLTLSVMTVLSLSATGVVYYTSTNTRSSTNDRARQIAFSLAEAGINNSMAVLSLPTNDALDQTTLPRCTTTGGVATSWASRNTSTYEGGTVYWCGDLALGEAAWYLTSIGVVRNPTGGTDVTRTLTAYVPVQPVVSQNNNTPAWNYIFATATGNTCDMTLNENVTMESALFVEGNLCLNNNTHVKIGPLIVKRRLSVGNTNSDVGTSGARIKVSVGGYDTGAGVKHCQQGGNHWHDDAGDAHPFCGDADKVYSVLSDGTTVGVNPTPDSTIAKPASNFALWYADAKPGPSTACTSQSGTPPTFESTGSTTWNNSVAAAFNLTPAASYTCRVGPAYCPSCTPATNPIGELSWDAATKTLSVRGVVFIDGSAYSNNGAVNQYNGRGTLYLAGTFLLDNNSKLCGGIVGSNCDYSTWNPNTELFTIVAGGNGQQGIGAG
ncbi:MAG: PilX N-terminal domain-containing pilus assembly protein, partial [Gaiellaceae bacterium]